MTVTVWVAEPASYDALPAWSASTTHEPGLSKRTVDPVSEQTLTEPAATESTTGLPEAPPWVVTAQVWPTDWRRQAACR